MDTENEQSPIVGEVIEGPVIEQPKQVENRDAATGKFIPGVSGNPHGRPPRDWTWAGLIEDMSEEYKETKNGGKVQWRKLVIRRLLTEAANGNIRAIELVIDRMDGKASQNINIGGLQTPVPIIDVLKNNVSNNDGNKKTE